MSKLIEHKNTIREQQSYDRILFMKKASEVLLNLFNKDFKSVEALSVLLRLNQYQFDNSRLLGFYNFRLRDEEVLKALEECLQKLN